MTDEGLVGLAQDIRAVVKAHEEECGARAPQMLVGEWCYPDELVAWAETAERAAGELVALRAVVDAARRVLARFDPPASVVRGPREATSPVWLDIALSRLHATVAAADAHANRSEGR